jgi:hypothetical protein
MDARIDFVLSCSGSCQRTAKGLEDQRDEIGADEYDCVRSRRQERERSSVSLYDAAEGEVDWRGDQGRGDREADQLDDKVSGSRLLEITHR